MAQTQFNQNVEFQGIVDTAIGIPVAGLVTVDVKCTIPTLVSGGGVSALIITIKQNSSTIYTGTAGNQGAWVQFTAAAGDVLHVITSSANAVDSALNAVKGVIAVSTGY